MKCPGCSAKYIGKTERCLQSRLSEHINLTKSAIGQYFHDCQHVQYIVNLHFAFDKLYNSTDEYNKISAFISNLIIDNSRILHATNSRTPNFLLLLEAIYIKYHSHSSNTGLKATILDKTIDYTLVNCSCLRLQTKKTSSSSPPNTMLNICKVVITHKPTLIGGEVGEVSLI